MSLHPFVAEFERTPSERGLEAWLSILDHSDAFFMVTEGGIAFEVYSTAAEFPEEFDQQVAWMEARFGHVGVDSLNPRLATCGAT